MTEDLLPNEQHQLSLGDSKALDALIDASFDVSRVPEPLRVRAARVAALLGLLDVAPAGSNANNRGNAIALIDLTLARVQRTGEPEVALSADDIEALDAYVAAEFKASKVAAALRPRADQIESMVQLIAQTSTTGAPSLGLVEQTMRRVASAPRERAESFPLRASGGFRFADLISVAAVLLMGVAVLWPVLSTVRGYQQKSGCAANLGSVASAMSNYARDNKSALPLATASFGGTWLDVGSSPDRSNSANLFTLARQSYLPLRTLACAGNPNAVTVPASQDAKDWHSLPEVSYSYYIMFGKHRPSLDSDPGTVILADRSPVVIRVANHDQVLCPQENSPNHAGRGQWTLRNDGSANWLSTPNQGDDNIWLPKIVEDHVRSILPEVARRMKAAGKTQAVLQVELPSLNGSELPESVNDSFVGP